MKRRLLYPYHFNFGTSRTQGQNHALLLQHGRAAQPTTKQKNVQQKGNKRLTSR